MLNKDKVCYLFHFNWHSERNCVSFNFLRLTLHLFHIEQNTKIGIKGMNDVNWMCALRSEYDDDDEGAK